MTTETTQDSPPHSLRFTMSQLLPWAAALVTVVLWASAFVAIRHLGDDFSPGPLTLGRLTTSSRDGSDSWGVLLCVVAAVVYSIAVVAQKPLLASLPALQVTWLACTIGLVVCLPFAPQLVHETADASPSAIGWVVYLGALPTALAFTTWAYALARTTAGRLGATTYLVPPVAILLGWSLLGETPVALAFVGGAMCLFGVYVTRRVPRQAR